MELVRARLQPCQKPPVNKGVLTPEVGKPNGRSIYEIGSRLTADIIVVCQNQIVGNSRTGCKELRRRGGLRSSPHRVSAGRNYDSKMAASRSFGAGAAASFLSRQGIACAS